MQEKLEKLYLSGNIHLGRPQYFSRPANFSTFQKYYLLKNNVSTNTRLISFPITIVFSLINSALEKFSRQKFSLLGKKLKFATTI